MNFRDTEALLGLFIARGYKAVNDPAKADVVLANTCSVRALAENKARSFLGEFATGSCISENSLRQFSEEPRARRRQAPAAGQKRVIGLIGCMARNEGKRLFQKMAHLDLICAPGVIERIPGYVEQIISGERKRIIDLEDRMRDEAAYEAPYRSEQGHANVVISTGCANSCSYCIVPYVRGKLRLRSPKDILAEVKRAVKNGASKITLLGQNVNDYNYVGAERAVVECRAPFDTSRQRRDTQGARCIETPAQCNFIDLLKLVSAIDGVKEIDFVSSNPKNTSKELFRFMAQSKKMKKYINLPFQSGSNRILKAMDRGYMRQEYLTLVKSYKRIVGGQISTDIIVGFPGETDADFKATRKMVEQCKFDFAFIFKYSVRPHSPAAGLIDDVPKEIKEKRHQELLALQKRISIAL